LTTEAVSTFFALSAIVILVLFAGWAILWTAAGRSERAAGWKTLVVASLGERAPVLAWIVAVIAMAGSLYYSEIAHFTPCEFCWYQRIAMYPLALVLGIAAFRRDRQYWRYALPVVVIGGILSTYHYLMQRFPDLSTGSCSAFAPCTAAYVKQFGFVSIPLMALACFAAIGALLAIGRSADADRA
jgi:disulfide bond formation protein DsbB